MSHFLLLILKTLSVILGLFLIITRLFVFEKTQGTIQSKIENLWIRMDDYEKYALSKHTAFMQTVSGVMNSGLDRIFGPRLLSLRSLTVSVCYAIATFFVGAIVLIRYSTGKWDKDYLQFIVLYLGVGNLPVLFHYAGRAKRKKYLLIWLTAAITAADCFIAVPAFQFWKEVYFSPVGFLASFILIAYSCVILALTFYAIFIMLIRISLRAIHSSKSLLRTAVVSLLNILPLFSLYALIKLLSYKLDHSQISPDMDFKNLEVLKWAATSWSTRLDFFLVFLLIAVFLFDIVFVISALVFALLALVMFLHRLFWPVLSRVLYASQRFRIVKNGMALIYAGVILIILGLGKISWLKAILNLH